MAKPKNIYICQNCGAESLVWQGQCRSCGKWNTLVETIITPKQGKAHSGRSSALRGIKLSEIKPEAGVRINTGINEFDRVLGGGIVPGQVILLAGNPGVGKSTLLTQISAGLKNKEVLYVCGEESAAQIKLRTDRMNYPADNLVLLQESDADELSSYISENKNIGLVIVDSIQTITSSVYTGMPGSIGQVRGATLRLIETAKSSSIPFILVGHVTKEGTVAGPKVLEHMVDTVLYLEGDENHLFRILKTTKNRFGPVSEIGIFEITETGMNEIENASKFFLSNQETLPSGTCLTVAMEGFRPILFEIQALTVKTAFGYPKRTASGFNLNRLNVLIATLEKRCKIKLSEYDVYLSVSGGYKVSDYSCDLAVCLALASSVYDKSVGGGTVAFGECDLSGGVRKVVHQDLRIKELTKLGYKKIISPKNSRNIMEAISAVL